MDVNCKYAWLCTIRLKSIKLISAYLLDVWQIFRVKHELGQKWWWWWRRQRRLERRSLWMRISWKLSSTYDEDEKHFRKRRSFLFLIVALSLYLSFSLALAAAVLLSLSHSRSPSIPEHSFSIISNVFIWNRFNSERVSTSNRNFLFCLSGV